MRSGRTTELESRQLTQRLPYAAGATQEGQNDACTGVKAQRRPRVAALSAGLSLARRRWTDVVRPYRLQELKGTASRRLVLCVRRSGMIELVVEWEVLINREAWIRGT